MPMLSTAFRLYDHAPIPDAIARTAIHLLVARTAGALDKSEPTVETTFAQSMIERPIAEHTAAANSQHYEVPAAFFELILGPRRKYSCCYYHSDPTSLADAEEQALALTAQHAAIVDGQRILELGCGWGSLSLWLAERYRNAQIMAVSNSHSQRAFIEAQARIRRLRNLTIVTADMNEFDPGQRFQRIVSVEMFEHMANWRALLTRVHSWLTSDGQLFLHVFSDRRSPYRFEVANNADWIAQHFFTGGIMPSHGLIRQFDDVFRVETQWRWSGRHYQRTALDWLANYDRNGHRIEPILRDVYGDDAATWHRRWRLFFLATAGLFGYRDGSEWGVSHYRLNPVL
jgi:cyclopropane-fatty-acyl-phospholipid synthase